MAAIIPLNAHEWSIGKLKEVFVDEGDRWS